MGKKQSRVEAAPAQPERRELTALERWNQSQRSQEELLLLLNQSNWAEWSPAVATHLRSITSRERYQLHTAILLQFLKHARHPHPDREQLYSLYSQRLAASFFVPGEFHEPALPSPSPKDKLLFLYDYYPQLPEPQERALACNYPAIFTQFGQFISMLVEREIVMGDMETLKQLIPTAECMQQLQENCEINLKFYPNNARERVLEELKALRDPKTVFMAAIEEFMHYDNADAACQLIEALQMKGYVLSEPEQQQLLTLRLYALFVYSLGKLSLPFASFRSKTTQELLHLFYSEQSIEQTPLLLNCFRGATHSATAMLADYCFSPMAHISLAVRLMERGYLKLSGSRQEWQQLQAKVLTSGCEIGRYCDYLTTLAQTFKTETESTTQLCHLLKLAEILHLFATNATVQDIAPLVYTHQQLAHTQSTSLKILQLLIAGFFTHDEIQSKSIVVQGQKYTFATLFDLLRFLANCRQFITRGSIKIGTVHQILFTELLARSHYQEVGALLRKQNINDYSICFEVVEPLVVGKMIELVTTRLIRKIEGSLAMLMSSIGLTLNSSHYAVAYYRYFCCLEDADIQLPPQSKTKIGLNHLYYIVDTFPTKIQKIDFDYLHTQQTCIRQLFNDPRTDFIAPVTDQYLKFKTYLSSRCFALKKLKTAQKLLDQVLVYQPPWLATELVGILRTHAQMDENVLSLAFNYCRKGEDLQYIMELREQQIAKKNVQTRLSVQSIKKLGGELVERTRYVCLDNQVVVHEQQYANLVAQMTFGKEQLKEQSVFFRLLTVQPMRAFNYAVNFNITPAFIVSFLSEGLKRGVLHLHHLLPYLIRYLYFRLLREQRDYQYIRYREFKTAGLQELTDVSRWEQIPSVNGYVFTHLKKNIQNLQINKLITPQFLELYVPRQQLYRFLFQQAERRQMVLELRGQPMTKPNARILRRLCTRMGVDIVELSLYELAGKLNSEEEMEDAQWDIVLKLIFWGQDRPNAQKIITKLSQKVQSLKTLIGVYEYMRQSEPLFKQVITEEHLQIIKSLAEIEQDNNFFGIIPDNYFKDKIGVKLKTNRGVLSDKHRQILEKQGAICNIFLLSKALYFMYGCDEEIQKVVLGEFSLRQPDSEEFQILRKKIKMNQID